MAKQTKTYSESIVEIEQILEEIENNDMDIDILSQKVESAAKLIRICKEKLLKTDANLQKILDEIEDSNM